MDIIAELLAALEAVEFVGISDDYEPTAPQYCPWCGGYKLDDDEKAAGFKEHEPDCKRQSAISRVKGTTSSDAL